MADFCTKCSIDLFPPDIKPDIDVVEEFNKLEPNYMVSCLCEGCGLISIGKNENNQLVLQFIDDENDVPALDIMSIEEYKESLNVPKE